MARNPTTRQASPSERELELKYSVSDEDAVRALIDSGALAGFEAGPWRVIEVSDRYIDTPNRALARAGYGARLRDRDGHSVVTLKKDIAEKAGSPRRSRALANRMELEAPAAKSLDPRRWQESAARSLVEATAREEPLRTLFVLDQRREERDIVQDGEVVAKLSLDVATVRRFGRERGTFVTLEIEAEETLGEDRRIVLDQIAALLDGSDALRPEPRSKERIAQQLIDRRVDGRRTIRPPQQPGVTIDDPLSEAGRKVLRMHLLRMLSMERGVRESSSVEAVHKMRVATRRMRAAWRVFDGAYRPRFARRYVEELRTVASALGAVRDRDVQLERLEAYRTGRGDPDGAALEPLADELRRRRAQAAAQLADLLDSDLYDRFTTDYLTFVDTPGAGATGNARVADVAGGRVWRAYERLRAHDAMLEWADTDELHALRIDAKRFRYTLEFFGEVLGIGRQRIIADVTRIQDELGELNDAHITAELARAWLLERGPSLTAEQRAAVSDYLHAAEVAAGRLRRSFRPLWRTVTGRPFRRRLGIVISEP